MAVAEYFQRNAMAVNQLLSGIEYEGLMKILSRHRIGLVVDRTAASHEGRATADLVVRLLARFYPKIAIVAADSAAKMQVRELAKLAKAINPKISLVDTTSSVTHCLAIGNSIVELKRRDASTIYVGSANWLARVSHKGPVGTGGTKNPFGAGAAACLAVAKVFRMVFAGHLSDTETEREEIALSLLTLNTKKKLRGRGYHGPNLGKVLLVGAGAIGNGALWALASAQVSGELIVVDPQIIELTNLQRYVMAVRKDVGSGKAVSATQWLSCVRNLRVQAHCKSWDDYARYSDWLFPRVLVAVDTADARIGVQASLPKWIVNSWTRDSSIGISRHPTLDNNGGSCLACLYLPEGEMASEDEIVASALGFSTTRPKNENQELRHIRERLDRNIPCDRKFLEQVSNRKGVAIEALLPFENRSLRDLYSEGICGGQVIELLASAGETRAEVPMAFQSALAGVILAAELVVDALGARASPQPETTRIDLLEQLKSELSTPSGKDRRERCLCQDADFQDRYREKYG
jgi:hypothetical protein